MTKTTTVTFALAAGLALGGIVHAGTSVGGDHLKCYKVKDSLAKKSYTADLTALENNIGVESGCTIKVPAKLLCTATAKTQVMPPHVFPPGPVVNEVYACYQLKCAKTSFTHQVTDQFGDRIVTTKNATLLCAPGLPVAGGAS